MVVFINTATPLHSKEGALQVNYTRRGGDSEVLWHWIHFSVIITAVIELQHTNDKAILSQGDEGCRGREPVTFLRRETSLSRCPEGSSSKAPCTGNVFGDRCQADAEQVLMRQQ